MHLKGLDTRNEPWTDIDAFERVFRRKTTETSGTVQSW